MDYVSLHNHTTFSIMDSLIKPSELFKRAKELGQPAIAVTDHGTCAGLWDCLKLSRSTGVKLIAGCEMYFVDDVKDTDARLRHIVLLAKNAEGYKNLLTLVKAGFDNNIIAMQKVFPRVDWEILEKYSSGLICTTACGNGIISQLLNDKKFDEAKAQAKRLVDIFGDDLAIELQPHAMRRKANLYGNEIDQTFTNRQLKKLADELGIKCIVATDAHYVRPEQHKAHDVMLAIGSRQPISSGARLKYNVPDFYIKSDEEILSKLKRAFGEEFAKECIENTIYFSDKCEFPDWIDPKYSNPSGKELPEFPVKDQKDYGEFKEWLEKNPLDGLEEDKAYLRYRCDKAVNERVPAEKQAIYRERLETEFEVIEYQGFSSYMLIVSDYLEFCRNNNIRLGPGRGSCGGCMIAYLIDIHVADPLKYGLIFERFHNKEKSAPDIDSDVCPSQRPMLHEYIRNKYGEDHVAHVSNVNTLTPKPYVKAIARTFEYGGDRKTAVAIGAAIADAIPADIKTIKSALEKAPLFAEYAKRYPELVEFGDDICGKAVAWSTHAGGLVICARSLVGLIPLRRDKEGSVSIEYEKERAEENGLLKMDTLAIETLHDIDNTYALIKKAGKELPPDPPNYDECDVATYDMISNGDTFGVFQLGTSGGTIDLCRKVKPKNLDDLAVINSLARPSARDIRKDYIQTKNGDKPVEIIHPSLERAFRPTLGFGLYEECLMFLAQDVAGWSMLEADRLRKLTKAKGKYPEKVKKWEEDFIQGSIDSGVGKKFGKKIWSEVIEKFGGYGFNRSLYFLETVDIFSSAGKYLYKKPIQDIQPGEFVRSRDEETGEDIYIEVIGNYDHGKLEVVEVELNTGEKVKCTLDHKFRVQETGEMLPLWKILEDGLSIVVG